jgi:hypothetical protein
MCGQYVCGAVGWMLVCAERRSREAGMFNSGYNKKVSAVSPVAGKKISLSIRKRNYIDAKCYCRLWERFSTAIYPVGQTHLTWFHTSGAAGPKNSQSNRNKKLALLRS